MRPAAIRDALIDQERIVVATQQQGVEADRRLLAKADLIARTGKNPDARPYEELKALLDKRQGR